MDINNKGLDNLEIYKLAEELEVFVFETTKVFPKDEKFRSVDQLRRSSASVSDNIAEGYGRYSFQDKINKFYTARGEAEETRNSITKSFKKNFISKEVSENIDKKYIQLIKQINAYINFLRRKCENSKSQLPSANRRIQSPINQAFDPPTGGIISIRQPADQLPSANRRIQSPINQSFSLILTLLIISSILTGTMLVSDITIRHSQTTYGAEVSEKAYFAAESVTEIAAYNIFKNYKDITTYSLSGTLTDGETTYSATVGPDTTCPNVSECNLEQPISATNPWSITLKSGESFQLDLDFNGVTYPSSLTISKAGNLPSDLIVYECSTVAGPPRECSSSSNQNFHVSFPQTISTVDYLGKYYKIRINNVGIGTETYTLTPNSSLPIGIEITAIGGFGDYEREVTKNIPHWQKYGAD